MLFWKTNDNPLINIVITISERKDCIKEIPAALIAVSSLLSPKLPNVINEDSKIANGKACGTSINPIYQKNFAMTSMESPLPINSSIYRHKNCIISTNWQMKNVPTKSIPNCLAINISSFFILIIRVLFHVSCTHTPYICKSSINLSDFLSFSRFLSTFI